MLCPVCMEPREQSHTGRAARNDPGQTISRGKTRKRKNKIYARKWKNKRYPGKTRKRKKRYPRENKKTEKQISRGKQVGLNGKIKDIQGKQENGKIKDIQGKQENGQIKDIQGGENKKTEQ